MSNVNLWHEILKRLRTIPDYETGAIITLPDSLGNETRCYGSGRWVDNGYLGLFEAMDVPELTLRDVFPTDEETDVSR